MGLHQMKRLAVAHDYASLGHATVKFLLDLSIQLASALNYAWEKFQMIHGDIKPGNMLICKNGNQLKLCDLGLARSGSDV